MKYLLPLILVAGCGEAAETSGEQGLRLNLFPDDRARTVQVGDFTVRFWAYESRARIAILSEQVYEGADPITGDGLALRSDLEVIENDELTPLAAKLWEPLRLVEDPIRISGQWNELVRTHDMKRDADVYCRPGGRWRRCIVEFVLHEKGEPTPTRSATTLNRSDLIASQDSLLERLQ